MFNQIFGDDFLVYVYDKNKGTSVDENIVSGLLEYNHDSWETEYLKQLTEFSDKVTESNAPMQNCGPKQLDFTDAQTAPAPSHAKSNSSEEKDEAGQTNSFNKGRATQPCTQLSSALFTASTRAELAALDMLVPPVSSISSLLTKPSSGILTSLPIKKAATLMMKTIHAILSFLLSAGTLE